MRLLTRPILAFFLLIGSARAAPPPEPEIWFNSHGPVDMMDLFADDAPWEHAANHVNVLVLVHWWIRTATDAQLLQIRDFAIRHHMKIDIDSEPVARFGVTDGFCGQGEGYSMPGELLASAQILARLGFRVDYIDMDEPIWFGHYSTDPYKCQLSIPDLISRTAMNMKDALSVFPNAQIVDIEPMPALTQSPTWRADTTAFHLGLAQQLGRRVHSMQFDVSWNNPEWRQSMRDAHAYLRQNNMGLAIILNGTELETTDTDWLNHAVSNFEAVEGTLQIIPDQVLFTSWNNFPQYNLPETSATAQT